MIRSLLFIILVGFGWSLEAQSFVVSEQYSEGIGAASSEQFSAEVHIKNNTASALNLVWERKTQRLPNGWQSALCDHICYLPFIGSQPISIGPYQEINFRTVFYPNDVSGKGTISVALYDPMDSLNTAQLITFQGSTPITGTSNISSSNEITVFPNPAITDFQINNPEGKVKQIELFNLVGKKVATYSVSSPGQRFPISNLSQGFYLVRFLDRNGEILFTQRVGKYNP